MATCLIKNPASASRTEGRQAEERLKAVGPLGAMFSLEVKAVTNIQGPVRVLGYIFLLNRQVHVFSFGV